MLDSWGLTTRVLRQAFSRSGLPHPARPQNSSPAGTLLSSGVTSSSRSWHDLRAFHFASVRFDSRFISLRFASPDGARRPPGTRETNAECAEDLDLESGWAAAAQGSTLLHADLRADNLLLTRDGSVMVIDWPYAVSGASWVDALLFLVSAAADGGADPEEAWRGFGPARQAEPGAVNAVLAAAAGDFTCQSLLPAPLNIPSLRGHQRAKGDAAVRWLRSRVRWQ